VLVPVLFLLLFAGVFGHTLRAGLGAVVPSGGGYIDYLTPGILLMTACSTAEITAVNVSTDMTEGIIARFRTMAITRASVLTGQVLGGLIRAMISAVLVVAVALGLGFHPTATAIGWIEATALFALLAVAVTWLTVSFGLLAEPARDASGYRRYGAQAVVDLVRIKTLAEADVPLARIAEILAASPGDFAGAVEGIDRALGSQIRELRHRRRRLAQLTQGEHLYLPEEVVAILEAERAMGVSERTVGVERDAWILVAALSPELVPAWAAEKARQFSDPAFRRVYLACDAAYD